MPRNEPPQNRRVNLRAIIFKDGKLFCQRLKNSHTLHDSDFWCTPGGGIDFGESLYEGLTREMIEETGVKPVIGNILFIQQFMDGEREHTDSHRIRREIIVFPHVATVPRLTANRSIHSGLVGTRHSLHRRAHRKMPRGR